jgi:putative oxidoreductase
MRSSLITNHREHQHEHRRSRPSRRHRTPLRGHGTQKLFGWFGGHGPEGTGGYFESLGLRPGVKHAKAAGAAEAVGGALLTAGALTPLASTVISATMLTAARKAHLKNGPWVTEGGYEYNLVLVAAMTALADTGPGKPSIDAALFPKLRGPALAVASLAAAAAGSALATSSRFTAPAPAAQEGQSDFAGDPAATDDDVRFTRPEDVQASADAPLGDVVA